jgi:2-phospho-L-lactate guanylyltransferase
MNRADLTSIVAIVPVSSLSEAKSRLGEPLDPEERGDLVLGLLRRTVRAALESHHLAGVVVVSKDQELLAAARALGAATLAQGGGDLNSGLTQARLSVSPAATAVLVLPVDLPMISAAEIDRLVEVADVASLRSPAMPLVVLVPDHHRTGTNALLVSPPTTIPFRFGEGSRATHAAEATAAEATYEEVLGPLTFDVDTAEDLLKADMSGLGRESGR